MGHGVIRIALVVASAAWAMLAASGARAANGAYAVDAADISEVGSCKVESWFSTATNTDFSAVANPSCVVDLFRPVELSLLTNRSRSDGDWSTTIAPKAKTNIVPTGIGRFGISVYAGGQFDALTGENLTAFAVVPATYRFSETMRINLNGGWLWDRTVDRHYLTYGVGFDWKFTDVLQWTIEAFGQAGASDTPERGPAAISDRRPLPAQRDFLGRRHLRPQHHRRKRQLDHDRDHDPVSGAGGQTGAGADGASVTRQAGCSLSRDREGRGGNASATAIAPSAMLSEPM